MFLTQGQVDKVKEYLLETFLPFALAQYASNNGKKGFDQTTIDDLTVLLENEDWTEKNLPIRDLSEKDVKALGEDTEFVAKLSYSGSGGNEISKRALDKDDDDTLEVVNINTIEGAGDMDRLWWGAGNTFRGAFNLNAYTRVVGAGKATVVIHGITAYTRSLYLRADLPMRQSGGGDDEAVLEDDFED